MKVYLSGPMSGYEKDNLPAFHAAAKTLRARGYEIVSPAELDEAAGDRHITTWGDFLARDVKLLADGGIGGIIFLPFWYKSRGARLEAMVGLLHPRIPFSFWLYERDTAVSVSARFIMKEVAYATA